jgi:FkbM family methyltransferase
MLTRDKNKDTFISGTIQAGQVFDMGVRDVIVSQLSNKTAPVFLDIGANIGYMSSTALALGATVFSLEPFQGNMAILMNTVRKNHGWRDRSYLYMNALSYESVRVTMKSTNEIVNLSNMHIVTSQCTSPTDDDSATDHGVYGVDYMEAVSLDQVMLTHHPEVTHVDLIKIDVETHEMEVINGGMHFLCHRVVNMIIMEVEYLKPHPEIVITCDFAAMQDRLERMGFTVWDCSFQTEYTGKSLASMTTSDVVFVQTYRDQPPAQRLKGTENNPCESFEL